MGQYRRDLCETQRAGIDEAARMSVRMLQSRYCFNLYRDMQLKRKRETEKLHKQKC